MTIHFRQVCQYGFTHAQCRCPATDKAVDRIECPIPDEHGRPDRPKSSHFPSTTTKKTP